MHFLKEKIKRVVRSEFRRLINIQSMCIETRNIKIFKFKIKKKNTYFIFKLHILTNLRNDRKIRKTKNKKKKVNFIYLLVKLRIQYNFNTPQSFIYIYV